MKNLITVSNLRKTFATLFMALLIVGCGDTDPENKGNHLPDVNIVQNNKSVKVGEVVTLDGIALDVDKGDELTYQWSFISTPTGSSAELTTSRTTKTSFVADKAGEYKVKFVATDTVDANNVDIVIITATENGKVSNTCTSYIEIDENIQEDTTFDGCYKITRGILNISNNALLTINAGSTILFEGKGGIDVNSAGALKAIGTPQKPILFTGVQKTAGYWRGISFKGSNDIRNEIAYATLEYGGTDSYGSLYLMTDYGTDNRIKLSNTTFKNSASYGFAFEKNSKIDKFENITSTKNANTAGRVNMSLLDKLDSASDFTGNLGGDYITVEKGDVVANATWKLLSVPLYFKKDIIIFDDVLLTLEAGSHLVFNNGIKISTGSLGGLKAVGTKTKPILFTGRQQTAGYWAGILIGSNNIDNILEYTTVEYAKNGLYLDTHFANSTTARANVTNSTFRHNKNGIYIDYASVAVYNEDIESANTFSDNENKNIERN